MNNNVISKKKRRTSPQAKSVGFHPSLYIESAWRSAPSFRIVKRMTTERDSQTLKRQILICGSEFLAKNFQTFCMLSGTG